MTCGSKTIVRIGSGQKSPGRADAGLGTDDEPMDVRPDGVPKLRDPDGVPCPDRGVEDEDEIGVPDPRSVQRLRVPEGLDACGGLGP